MNVGGGLTTFVLEPMQVSDNGKVEEREEDEL
jgi:hypothetical protein